MCEAEVQVISTWFYPADRAESDPSPLGTARRRADLLECFVRTDNRGNSDTAPFRDRRRLHLLAVNVVCRFVRSNQMLLLRGFGEFVAELGMGEFDQPDARSVDDRPLRFTAPNSVTT